MRGGDKARGEEEGDRNLRNYYERREETYLSLGTLGGWGGIKKGLLKLADGRGIGSKGDCLGWKGVNLRPSQTVGKNRRSHSQRRGDEA